jgi:hypothetical protein
MKRLQAVEGQLASEAEQLALCVALGVTKKFNDVRPQSADALRPAIGEVIQSHFCSGEMRKLQAKADMLLGPGGGREFLLGPYTEALPRGIFRDWSKVVAGFRSAESMKNQVVPNDRTRAYALEQQQKQEQELTQKRTQEATPERLKALGRCGAATIR